MKRYIMSALVMGAFLIPATVNASIASGDNCDVWIDLYNDTDEAGACVDGGADDLADLADKIGGFSAWCVTDYEGSTCYEGTSLDLALVAADPVTFCEADPPGSGVGGKCHLKCGGASCACSNHSIGGTPVFNCFCYATSGSIDDGYDVSGVGAPCR